MTHFTTSRKGRTFLKQIAAGIAVAAFWLAVWQAAYLWVAQEILLVSPAQAVMRLVALAGKSAFWHSVGLTCLRVLEAFLAALAVGGALAALCSRFRVLRRLTAPLMAAVRATPVASFIILALVWMATDRVPVFSAFLMVIPIIWGNLSAGMAAVDQELLEMAAIFHFSRTAIWRYIYLPALLPHFVSACSAGLGFAWKSTIAAEVIVRPSNSIGQEIYRSKIYLETADLFAWTIAVILLSLIIEKLVMRLLGLLMARLGGPNLETKERER